MKKSDTRTKSFAFKQFKVNSGRVGMPVSTDGVLLGAWSDIHNSKRILDIGTGTGLLALMCAQRNHHCLIDAIEIDEQACLIAKNNFFASPWHTRICLQQGDVLAFPFKYKYDTVICNPPYFNNGEAALIKARAIARHTLTLEHEDLLKIALRLITEDGKACFILPEVEGIKFIEQAKTLGWYLSKLCEVKPTGSKTTSRLLIQLTPHEVEAEYQQIIIQENNTYTEDFIALTKDFYLKM
ncbi:methyltransferase [Vibrio sp. OCN044]|uniref:tRNA1(Val) (adenine(37)-N6)-methyltransferase n=1 Tax=Vibrio tetraodonis subsp. pristinus TaxID=2695891 RepID=A0A6L8LXS8_9VIBR|nr:methyltransferase [Vibrio tetraodonis]MYM59510.1 methyltransferase [Vibrio tetraodonis subsp. pristinus]